MSTTPTRWPHRVREPFDPEADLDYGIDWSPWLQEGESLAAYSWTVTGATAHDEAESSGVHQVFLTGPTGDEIRATSTITTDSTPPRTDERTLIIRVADR